MSPPLDIRFPLPAATVLPDYGADGLYDLASSLRAWLHDPEVAWPVGEVAAGEKALVILLVIDGLGDNFLADEGQGLALHAARRRALTSVCPSTTASAVTTLMTGVAPAVHGLNGWFIHDQRFGGVLAPLPLTLRGGPPVEAFRLLSRLCPTPSMFHHARRTVNLVSPADIAFSRFSLHHARGAHIEPYEGMDDFGAAILAMADALREDGGLIHAYYPGFDGRSHRYGCRSPEVLACLARLDRLFVRLQRALAGRDVRIVVTADHGFIDASPERCVDLPAEGEVARMLAAPLFGERRLAFCRVRGGAETDFEAWAAAELAGKGVAVPGEAFLASGLLGPGLAHRRLRERVGTHVLLMEPGWTIVDHVEGETAHELIGVHGGLSADEMRVPLIVTRT